MDLSNNMEDQIKKLQDKYYSSNKKNTFFKNKQKHQCADLVSTQIDMRTLLHNTVYVIPNTNHIYFHYPIFKTFANPNNFESIVHYFMNICNEERKKYNKLNLHINWVGYTISSHQRYSQLYSMFINIGKNSNFMLDDFLDKLYLYNPPSMLEQIGTLLAPLISPTVIDKVEIIPKQESGNRLKELFNSFNT